MLKFTEFPITAKFGQIDQIHTSPHTGIDYATPLSTQIQSIGDGIVQSVVWDNKIGNTIKVNLENGYQVVYGHLQNFFVKTGEKITEEQIIATSGNTGSSTTGPHLHLTALYNGNYVDPTSLINKTNEGIFSNITNSMQDKIGDFFINLFQNFYHFVLNNSDYAIIIIIIFTLFTMFGSKKAAKGIYWTIAIYMILHIIDMVIGGQ